MNNIKAALTEEEKQSWLWSTYTGAVARWTLVTLYLVLVIVLRVVKSVVNLYKSI